VQQDLVAKLDASSQQALSWRKGKSALDLQICCHDCKRAAAG